MITEDYVSFETAKLLKEKGFDAVCSAIWRYWENGIGEPCFINSLSMVCERGYPYCYNSRLEKSINDGEIDIACPTLQMAMKWLREMHKIHVSVEMGFDVDNRQYFFFAPSICKFSNKSGEYQTPFGEKEFDTYEEACKAAVKYCLENLI